MLDHEPAHVPIPGGGRAKINLLGPGGVPEIVCNIGIKRSDVRRLMAEMMAEMIERRDELLQEWERIHGRRDGCATEGGRGAGPRDAATEPRAQRLATGEAIIWEIWIGWRQVPIISPSG
jgi:hypothetical protein